MIQFDKLKKENDFLKLKMTEYEQELTRLRELVHQLMRSQYGRSKETLPDDNQMSLFEKPTTKQSKAGRLTSTPAESEPTTKKKQSKQVGRKERILQQFVEEKIHLQLDEADQHCKTCHHPLKDIGVSEVRREAQFIPAHVLCRIYLQHTYKCDSCSASNDKEVFEKPMIPAQTVPNGFGSSSLVAATLTKKYEEKVPAYRQELYWERLGLPLSRGVICSWHIYVCVHYLSHLVTAMHKELLTQPIIHSDETFFQVLELKKKTSYFWLLQSSKHAEHPMALFIHKPTRSNEQLFGLLPDYAGIIHCDMYSVYHSYEKANEKVTLSACWAHLRRYFYDALPQAWTEDMPVYQIVKSIDQIFKLEREWVNFSPADRLKQRRMKLKQIIEELFTYIHLFATEVKSQGSFQKAILYALNHRKHFETVLTDGRLELSNNLAERSIKAIVMGRKNFLFSASVSGAQSAGIIQSLIETAKLNGLDASKYLTYLLDKLPNIYSISDADLTDYMPWADAVQKACRFTTFKQRIATI